MHYSWHLKITPFAISLHHHLIYLGGQKNWDLRDVYQMAAKGNPDSPSPILDLLPSPMARGKPAAKQECSIVQLAHVQSNWNILSTYFIISKNT